MSTSPKRQKMLRKQTIIRRREKRTTKRNGKTFASFKKWRGPSQRKRLSHPRRIFLTRRKIED